MTDQTNKPVLDEKTFEKLLEAAFVLQEHNRKLRELEQSLESHSEQLREQEVAIRSLLPETKAEPDKRKQGNVDYTLTLAEIVEAQHQIQIRHLELNQALAVIAERVARITNASGAGIGILDGATVRYSAGAGSPALPVGSEVSLQSAICQANVRTGQVIRTEDVDTEFLFDPEPCRQRGIRSLVAVPIYRDGEIAGALELYFSTSHGFAEQDIHTCQLMAGLVTEALGRDAESKLKKSMAAERSTMLAAIEKLQPNLVALADEAPASDERKRSEASGSPPAKSQCWKCGEKFSTAELFCGNCGAPRASDERTSTLQSRLAAAWHNQQMNEKALAAGPSNGTFSGAARAKRVTGETSTDVLLSPDAKSNGSPEPFTISEEEAALLPSLLVQGDAEKAEALASSNKEIVSAFPPTDDNFLATLQGLQKPGRLANFWRSRRGDFYLAVAVILVVCVVGWGVWSSRTVGAAGAGSAISRSANRSRRPAPDADLSLFDKMLVSLGLAEPPEAPAYRGNPDIQVWVDLSTALYYCPGSDLYEKTSKGKLTTQREAQMDQFEPANRKVCD